MSAATTQAPNKPEQQQAGAETAEQQRKPVALEEDDEFEDFPVEGMDMEPCAAVSVTDEIKANPDLLSVDWPQEEAEVPGATNSDHLWEESWDDDDTNEDFSKQLQCVAPFLPPCPLARFTPENQRDAWRYPLCHPFPRNPTS